MDDYMELMVKILIFIILFVISCICIIAIIIVKAKGGTGSNEIIQRQNGVIYEPKSNAIEMQHLSINELVNIHSNSSKAQQIHNVTVINIDGDEGKNLIRKDSSDSKEDETESSITQRQELMETFGGDTTNGYVENVDEIKVWLNEMDLKEYYQIFIENGYDSMNMIKEIQFIILS